MPLTEVPRIPQDLWCVQTSYSCKVSYIFLPQSLRELVMSVNSQTQTTLSSMNIALQYLGSEVTAMKEYLLRRQEPRLKRKKVHVCVLHCVIPAC